VNQNLKLEKLNTRSITRPLREGKKVPGLNTRLGKGTAGECKVQRGKNGGRGFLREQNGQLKTKEAERSAQHLKKDMTPGRDKAKKLGGKVQ